MSELNVGVKATFSIQGKAVHRFSSSSGTTDSAAAASGVGEEGTVEGTGKYDYRYTGRHDHGTLPALKTGGPHGELANAILRAKEDSDAFLTGLINQELAAQKSNGRGAAQDQEKSPLPETELDAAIIGHEGQGSGKKPESMELELGGAVGGTASTAQGEGGGFPPTPPSSAQPAKRPKP